MNTLQKLVAEIEGAECVYEDPDPEGDRFFSPIKRHPAFQQLKAIADGLTGRWGEVVMYGYTLHSLLIGDQAMLFIREYPDLCEARSGVLNISGEYLTLPEAKEECEEHVAAFLADLLNPQQPAQV